jgi:hypothetical protein
MYIRQIARDALPKKIAKSAREYTTFYTVQNFDAEGVIFFYIGKGYRHPSPEYANVRSAHDPKEYVVIYCNGEMAHGCAENLQGAVEMGQRLGWLCTGR